MGSFTKNLKLQKRMYKITFSSKAKKNWDKIPEKWQQRLRKRIDTLKENPLQGKKLNGDLNDFYSIKVWPCRVIYKIFKKEVEIFIVDVGHSQSIYKSLS